MGAVPADVPASPAPRTPLRIATVMKRYGFVRKEQLTEAIDRLSFPKGVIKATVDGALINARELDRFQEWSDQELTAYDDVMARVFPAALPKR